VLSAHRVRSGDALVGLSSTGLHTNGYSLARRIIAERMELRAQDEFPGEEGRSMADVMLAVHRSYLPALRPALQRVHAMAHITGGGLPGNLPRSLPSDMDAIIDGSSWRVPNVFLQLERAGNVSREEMFRTFNMGVGMVVITDPNDVDAIIQQSRSASVDAWPLGHVAPGAGNVIIH
jgi:phosphoribosylformylglycinamidine cyclo-ligase